MTDQVWWNRSDSRMSTLMDFVDEQYVSSGGASSALLLTATVTLTDAQIKALPTTPVEIVPALTGKVLVPVSGFARLVSTAGAYGNIDGAAGGYVTVGNQTGQGFGGSGFFVGTVDRSSLLSMADYANLYDDTSDFAGLPITVYVNNNGAGAFTGGNAANTMRVAVFYVIVDVP